MKETPNNSSFFFFSDDLLHRRVIDFSLPLYKDGHFKQAAHEAMIQVEEALREKGLYDKSLFGRRLTKFAFGNKAPITLEVPLGAEFQEQAQAYFESVFAYYRNYTAHESTRMDRLVCARILVVASELLELISASSIPFKGMETVDALINSELFKSRTEFYSLFNFLVGQQFWGEVFDAFFEDLANNGFSERQYTTMFDLGLVVYKNQPWVHEDPWGDQCNDHYGWIEATPLGELVLAELQKGPNGS